MSDVCMPNGWPESRAADGGSAGTGMTKRARARRIGTCPFTTLSGDRIRAADALRSAPCGVRREEGCAAREARGLLLL